MKIESDLLRSARREVEQADREIVRWVSIRDHARRRVAILEREHRASCTPPKEGTNS